MSEIDYEALQARLTDPNIPVKSAGQVETSEPSETAGKEWLLREYGSEESIEAAMRPGRPKVGAARGASPTVRARLSEADYKAFQQLQDVTGRSQSELVRDAVRRMLQEHQAAS